MRIITNISIYIFRVIVCASLVGSKHNGSVTEKCAMHDSIKHTAGYTCQYVDYDSRRMMKIFYQLLNYFIGLPLVAR